MFENKVLLVERIVVIEKAAHGFANGHVPDASASISHKHIAVDETRIALVSRQLAKNCQYLQIDIIPIPVFIVLSFVARD